MNTKNYQKFKDAIYKRSLENEQAFYLLSKQKLYTLIGVIIRLELDSLMRFCYLESLEDDEEKDLLINQFLDGKRWELEKGFVTDRKMVEHMTNTLMLGWALHIYDIGCAFVHLSPYHDWAINEPTRNLTIEQRQNIASNVNEHVRCGLYKKYNKTMKESFDFNDLVEISEDVFCKLKDNLRYELKI